MGTQRLPTRTNGQIIDESWFNAITRLLLDYVVPRNSADGSTLDLAGSLGTPVLRWVKAFVSEGHWSVGDYKMHHSYNGAVGPGEGWMLCDGRVISEANYDTEHGAGSWDTYIGTSPLDGKYLPDFDDRYFLGKATTTQDGSGAITAVGNLNSRLDMTHIHKAFESNAANTNDQVWDSAGSLVTMSKAAAKSGATTHYLADDSGGADMYTQDNTAAGIDIRPDSIEVQIYMRII